MGERVWAIVVAAGTGARYGGLKQFEALGDRMVVEWAVSAARTVADGVVVVVPPALVDDHRVVGLADAVVAGGATRSQSVRRGLAAVAPEAEVVVVHDAARPLASPRLFAAVVVATRAEGVAGAVPGLPVADTVKTVRDGRVVATLERSELAAVQTPQAFLAEPLRLAHETGAEATDDAALVEALGATVAVVPGEASNRKVTTADDLAWARTMVAASG